MIETFKNAFKIKEVRNKILFTLLFVVLYRLGCFIPVPGLNFSSIAGQFEQANIFNLLNSVTGSALSQGTIFAIGISPYINASIIIQLLTVAIPSLERMSKEGEEGKAKIEKITRWVTLALAIISAVGILFAFQNAASGQSGSIIDPNFFGEWLSNVDWLVFVYASIVLVGGSMLCMWIGERITEYGISNGISVLIFVGILSTAFNGIFKTIGEIPTNISRLWELLGFLATSLLVFAFIVWVNGAERKIKVQYAKQVKGNKMYGGQST
ncbi:MAG: preprotein translocase subunit SecY, partial [Clostridia bacterium]